MQNNLEKSIIFMSDSTKSLKVSLNFKKNKIFREKAKKLCILKIKIMI